MCPFRVLWQHMQKPTQSKMPPRDGFALKTMLRSAANFAAFVVGVVAGVAQLAGFSAGIGRVVLTAVGIACLLFLVVRFSLLYYVEREKQVRKKAEAANQRVTAVEVAHQRYVDAIWGIIDQEGPAYQDVLEITVVVGTDDNSDAIIERRTTIPKPRVTQRAFRPIVPGGDAPLPSLEEIALEARMAADPSGEIAALPLVRKNLRVWFIFDPVLTNPVDWEVHYKPKGLWAPLRRDGRDRLRWTDRVPANNGGASLLSHLTVKFVFPASDKPPAVKEERGLGEVLDTKRVDGTDQWLIVWRDPRPAGHRYEWNVSQAVKKDRG